MHLEFCCSGLLPLQHTLNPESLISLESLIWATLGNAGRLQIPKAEPGQGFGWVDRLGAYRVQGLGSIGLLGVSFRAWEC